ncbi:MAG: putative glycoside hydrolase [Gemmatimonadota bacterium]
MRALLLALTLAATQSLPAQIAKVPRPEFVHGIYVPMGALRTPATRAKLIELSSRAGLNTWVIDIKTEEGTTFRPSSGGGAKHLADLTWIVGELHKAGLYVMGRAVTFNDGGAAEAHPDWAIKNEKGGGLWRNQSGHAWLSPTSTGAWNYNIAIALDAGAQGVDEVMWDYVRTPEPSHKIGRQVYPGPAGDPSDAVAGFLKAAEKQLNGKGIAMSAALFAWSMHVPDGSGVYQQWEKLIQSSPTLIPMAYPSHYYGPKGANHPNAFPYKTVHGSLTLGLKRRQALIDAGKKPGKIFPFLQAFDAPWVDRTTHYGPEQIAAQIRAARDLGIKEYLFWNPKGIYSSIEAGVKLASAKP